MRLWPTRLTRPCVRLRLRSGPRPGLHHGEPVIAVALEFEVSVRLRLGLSEGSVLGVAVENFYGGSVGGDDEVLGNCPFTECKEQANFRRGESDGHGS